MDYNTLEKLGKAVLYGNILASIHTPAQTKVQFDTALEMYKKYVGNVYNDTLPAPADVDAVEGDRCLLNVDNDYEAYEVVDGVWKKYTTKDGATTEADLTDYYTKPEVREYVDNLIKDFIPKNGDNTFSGSNTFTKPIVGDLSGNANTATKATKDSEGNVIKDTYATKTECNSKASLDATQMLAVNSGITASKVAEYETMKTSKVNEADIKTVAKTGSYSDLINKPTINDATINIKVNGVSVGTFTTNNASAKDIAITVPTKMSDLDNDSDYVASTTLHDYAKLTEVENKISELVNSAPETLDTLNELASALGNDPNFATTVANQIGTKANDNSVVHLTGDETINGVKDFTSTQKINALIINPTSSIYKEMYGSSEGVICPYGRGDVPESNINPFRFYIGKARNYASAPIVIDTNFLPTGGTNIILRTTSNESENALDHRLYVGTSVTDNGDGTKTKNAYVHFYNTNEIRPSKNNYCNLGTESYKWKTLYATSIFGGANNIDCAVDSQGDGWIRYSNGLQICFGGETTYPNDNTNNQFVTFPKSFSSNASVICQTTNPYTNGIMYGWINKQGFTVTSKGNYTFSYIAIGYWE